MRIKPLMNLLSLVLVTFSALAAATQTGPVKAKFEIDGKETQDKFRVVLYADGVATEPSISADGNFNVPPLTIPTVDVRLISGKHDLLYKDVYVTKLRGTLTFGVKEHFSGKDSHCKRRQKLLSS